MSFFSLYFIGLPLAFLLQRQVKFSPWVIAPFLALTIIVVVLQNLVYFNIPIFHSFIWLWLAAGVGWIFLFFRKQNFFAEIPWRLLLIAFFVYCLHSLGLFILGAKYYVAGASFDQINYVYMAQALADYPLNQLTSQNVINQPYALSAMQLISERIGQSVWHAFLLSSSFSDAKTTFEIAILIAPFLLVLAMYQVARCCGLSEKVALYTAGIAGCLPGIAILHVESFFSQSLAIPFLLLWPVIISEAMKKPTWHSVLLAAIIFAAAWSIYSEFFLLFIGIGCVVAVIQKKFFVLFAIFALGVVLNMGALPGLWKMASLQRLTEPSILLDFYPWAQFPVWAFETLWLGLLPIAFGNITHAILGFISVVLVLLAYMGLVLQRKDALTSALLVLALLPFVLYIAGGGTHGYQFYKLLLSVSPLLVLGIAVLRPSPWVILPLVGVIVFATAKIVYQSAYGKGRVVAVLYQPSMQQAQEQLEAMKGQDILLVGYSPFALWDERYVNGWLAYFARHNRVRVLNPRLGDRNIQNVWIPPYPLPDPFLLLASPRGFWGQHAEPLWHSKWFSLWRVRGNHWVVLGREIDPNRKRTQHWRVLAGQSGTLFFRAKVEGTRGKVVFSVKTDKGYERRYEARLPLEASFRIPIGVGETQFSIQTVGQYIPLKVSRVRILEFTRF